MRSSLLVVPAFLAAVVSADRLSAQTQGSWEIVPSPNGGPVVAGNTLLDVAALSPSDAWAVGFHRSPTSCTHCPAPLAIHWDGAAWSLIATPTIPAVRAELRAVAPIRSDDVWAVGYSQGDCGLCGDTLIEHWDGTRWSVVPSPNPGVANFLNGVATVSASDVWAVGYQWLSQAGDIAPIILHYDGAGWSSLDQSHLLTGQLSSVFALASDDVWAVGWIALNNGIPSGALALHWDGASWTRVVVPQDAFGYLQFRDVSGVASDDVWAVGVAQSSNIAGHPESRARTYHWDGTSWTAVLPGLGGPESRLYQVHAIASNDVWAVGGEPGPAGSGVAFRYVTVHWDGVNWTNVENPNQGVLYGVGASSSTDVWAVGFGFDSLGLSTGTHTLHYPAAACGADFDGDDAVSVPDIFAFLGAWFAGLPAADFDGNGVNQVPDIFAFLSAWFAGC